MKRRMHSTPEYATKATTSSFDVLHAEFSVTRRRQKPFAQFIVMFLMFFIASAMRCSVSVSVSDGAQNWGRFPKRPCVCLFYFLSGNIELCKPRRERYSEFNLSSEYCSY